MSSTEELQAALTGATIAEVVTSEDLDGCESITLALPDGTEITLFASGLGSNNWINIYIETENRERNSGGNAGYEGRK